MSQSNPPPNSIFRGDLRFYQFRGATTDALLCIANEAERKRENYKGHPTKRDPSTGRFTKNESRRKKRAK